MCPLPSSRNSSPLEAVVSCFQRMKKKKKFGVPGNGSFQQRWGKLPQCVLVFTAEGTSAQSPAVFFLRPNLSSYPRKSWRKIKPFFCFSLFQTPFHLRLTLIVQQHAAANSQNMSSIVITRRLNVSTVKEFTRLRMSGEG